MIDIFKPLIEWGKQHKGFAGFAAFLIVGLLIALFIWLSASNAAPLMATAGYIIIAAVFVLLVMLIVMVFVRSSPTAQATIYVTVVDENGKPVKDAEVLLMLPKLDDDKTDEKGSAEFNVNNPAWIGETYTIKASREGYAASEPQKVKISHNVSVQFILTSLPPQLPEEEPEEKSKDEVAPQVSVKKSALRQSYLSYVLRTSQALSLVGIDRSETEERTAQVNLQKVYTALLTLTPEDAQDLLRPGEVHWEVEWRSTSALEQLNKNNHLVLLGDPGSGKSTFVSFVAMCLAGEGLGDGEVNLSLLRAPLPQEQADQEESKKKPQRQPWRHGKLLPLKIVLRDFATRGLPPPGQKATLEHFWKFIENELKPEDLSGFVHFIKKEFKEKGGILLVDGLDEVPEAGQRRQQIKQVVEAFAATHPKCLVLVTSRTYAYQNQDWKLHDFPVVVLAPFSRAQIATFVDRWYECIAPLRHFSPDETQGKANLLKQAIFKRERLLELAERPLLLTLMASLHAWRSGTLPEKRQELYEETVDLLLNRWERRRVDSKEGRESSIEPGLSEWLKVREKDEIRNLLERLAFEAHAGQKVDDSGTADVPEVGLLAGLMKLNKNPEVKEGRLKDYLVQRAGLLLPRGEGVYTFPHRTIQEYLAACYLTKSGYPSKLAQLACAEPNRWREVALLAGAKAGKGAEFALWALADALSPQTANNAECDNRLQWGALIAGQALAESPRLEVVDENDKTKLERIQTRLVTILNKGELPAVERAAAGDTLAVLGDPRFDPDFYYLPRKNLSGFILIPAGPFLMGSDHKKDPFAMGREFPQHEVTLPDYYMGRYPVTVAQYRLFVEHSGYETSNSDSLRGPANHPVLWVSWSDGLAYADWLTLKLEENPFTPAELRSRLQIGWRITLPSKSEWEKAARGTDGRIYPWGNEFEPDKANIGSELGCTNTVGCFPGGQSPFGILDLSGNVWEWTRSLWGKDYREPDFIYPYDPQDKLREDSQVGRDILRVLRGGAFNYNSIGGRSAHRYRQDPLNVHISHGVRLVLSPFTDHL